MAMKRIIIYLPYREVKRVLRRNELDWIEPLDFEEMRIRIQDEKETRELLKYNQKLNEFLQNDNRDSR